MAFYQDPVIQYFVTSSALERIPKQVRRKKSIHLNGSNENIELFLRTVTAVNQLSIHGAVAELSNEAPKDFRAPEKPAALDRLEKMEIPTGLSLADKSTSAQQRRTCCKIWAKIRTIVRRPEVQQNMFWCGFEACRARTIVLNSWKKKDNRCNIYAENTRGTRVRGWIRKNTRIGPILNMKVCYRDDRYSIEVQIPFLSQDHTVSWVRIVNGVDKNVTESMLTGKKEDIASGKPFAKARPRRKPTVTLTSVSILVTERKWFNIETQRSHDH